MNTPASAVAEPTPTPPSLVGQVVSGRYRIQKLLGEGGMGAVYLAEHTHMRKRVALKLLHAEMSKDEEVLARFRREAEAAAHVEHPNVAAATDFGQTEDGAFFLVLEYVEGTSLRDILDKGSLDFSRALHVARQMGYALERAHNAGIVHRDLKPENIMLVRKGDDPDFVKVLDFGIAKIEQHPTRDATQPLTRFGTILGTPEYMAPEQALGETVGPGADLYAVGVMLYEMLTGKHPFDADDRMAILSMHIVAPVPKMSDRNPALNIPVPPPVEELARKLLEKDVKLRPLNARALIDAIDVAAAQSNIELPQAISVRSFGRESNPNIDLSRSPAPPTSSQNEVGGLPNSSRAPDSSWAASDALAKTDYGVPSIQNPGGPSANANTQFGTPNLNAMVDGAVDRVKKLPRNVVIGVAAGVPLFVLLLIVVLIVARTSSSGTEGESDAAAAVGGGGPGAAAARSVKASPEKLKAATAQGVPALETLAIEFPEDAAVHKQLATSLNEAGRTPEMLNALRRLAKIDKESIDDALMIGVILAAQRADTTDDAFALLEGPLGAKGVDALIELSTNKTIPPTTRLRATKSIARPEVRANASPAASVLLDVRAAKKCEDKHELLDRVKDNGDGRVMATLKTFKSPRGCGFMGMRDCYSCMRKDDALDDAIKAVEARSNK